MARDLLGKDAAGNPRDLPLHDWSAQLHSAVHALDSAYEQHVMGPEYCDEMDAISEFDNQVFAELDEIGGRIERLRKRLDQREREIENMDRPPAQARVAQAPSLARGAQ